MGPRTIHPTSHLASPHHTTVEYDIMDGNSDDDTSDSSLYGSSDAHSHAFPLNSNEPREWHKITPPAQTDEESAGNDQSSGDLDESSDCAPGALPSSGSDDDEASEPDGRASVTAVAQESEDSRTDPPKKGTTALLRWPIPLLFVLYCIPALLGTTSLMLYALVDMIVIGRACGADAMAGVSLFTPLDSVITTIGVSLGVGVGAGVSTSLGQKNVARARKMAGNAITLVLALGVVAPVPMLVLLYPFLQLTGADSASMPHALYYSLVMLPTSAVFLAPHIVTAMLRADEKPVASMLLTLVASVLNIGLDVLFVFGFGWGTTGAAVASVISDLLATIASFAYYYTPVYFLIHPRADRTRALVLPWRCYVPDVSCMVFMVRSAAVFSLSMIGFSTMLFLTNIAIDRIVPSSLTSSYLAGETAIYRITLLCCVPFISIEQAVIPLAAFYYGARLARKTLEVLVSALSAGLVVGVVCWLFITLLPKYYMRAFTDDADAIDAGVLVARRQGILFVVLGVLLPAQVFLVAVQRNKAAFITMASRQMVVGNLTVILGIVVGSIDLVFLATPIGDVVASVVSVIFLGYLGMKLATRSRRKAVEVKP
ncbi:Multi antimicrobial extrusion protein [Carpediemonas membranifera]|uniref:Multi antimicrobial extrusion protein n=1 Tax=Carpediemonas membranifera TaxID=201153 RepID=A0A8J6AX35_9EUKA|nr:Multi antimicrobial extrusion protein [Carpediemonas membranifera]|eukprot:KAG9390498.1 Multi antimicrobial extrusion protein [Carpediemonas membranifera]